MCCLSGQAHGGPWDLLGNSWEQEIQPTYPGSWCAMRDDGPSTDLDSSVPPRSLPSPWGRHLSLASCDDMKLPTWDPGQEPRFLPHYQVTKASPRDLDHAKGVAPWGKPFGPESPLQGSHVQQSKGITLEAAAIRPNSLWNCLRVSDWPSLILSTADRMDSKCAGWQARLHRRWVPYHAQEVVLCKGESTLFLAF